MVSYLSHPELYFKAGHEKQRRKKHKGDVEIIITRIKIMDVNDLMQNAKDLTDKEFEYKLNKLVLENWRYANLDSSNKKIVLDLVKKYKKRLRDGLGISERVLRNEMYRLRRDRLKLGLSEEDVKDIKEILYTLKT